MPQGTEAVAGEIWQESAVGGSAPGEGQHMGSSICSSIFTCCLMKNAETEASSLAVRHKADVWFFSCSLADWIYLSCSSGSSTRLDEHAHDFILCITKTQ